MRVDCIFCGFESYGVDGVRAHSATCNLHPLAAERDKLRAEVERLRGEVAAICRITKGNAADLTKPVDTVAEYVTEMRGRANAATARAEAAEADAAKCREEYKSLYTQVSAVLRDRDEARQLLRELAEIINPHDQYDSSKLLGWARDMTERAREADEAQAREEDLMAALEDLLPPKREVLTEPEQRAYAAISRTPAQSLGLIKAGVLREIANLIRQTTPTRTSQRDDYGSGKEDGRHYAIDQIEAEADRLEKEVTDAK